MSRGVARYTAALVLLILTIAWCQAGLQAGNPLKDDKTLSKEEYIERMSRGLDAVLKKTNPKHPLFFSGNLFYAHETAVKHTPPTVLMKYASALVEAGVHRIDINMGLFPWLHMNQETIVKYDALIGHIRRLHVEVVINPQYSPIYHEMPSFSDWRKAAFNVYAEIARRYKPDMFVVVHEPTTMSARIGETANVAR